MMTLHPTKDVMKSGKQRLFQLTVWNGRQLPENENE